MKDIMYKILFLAALWVVIGGGWYYFKSTQCDTQSVSFEEHHYDFFGGCMVKHKGMWLPLENIRGFD
jgi:hypothetical protein